MKKNPLYLFVVTLQMLDKEVVGIFYTKREAKKYIERLEEDILTTDVVQLIRWNTKTQNQKEIDSLHRD